MEKYGNLSGISGVEEFEIGVDCIVVLFLGGGLYLYTNESSGMTKINKMKKLAREGLGLSRYISTYVKDAFAERLK